MSVRAKHSGRQFISENQRFTAGMLRPYEDLCKVVLQNLIHISHQIRLTSDNIRS